MTDRAAALAAARAARAARYRAEGWWSDETLDQWLARAVAARGDRDALRQGDRRVTWAALGRMVNAFARGLDALGIGKGDVVAVQLPNVVEMVVAYLGITSRGAIMQTVHMPYRGAEIGTLLAHSEAVAAIVLSEAKDYRAAELLLGLEPSLPKLREVIAVGAPVTGTQSFAAMVADADSNPESARPVRLDAADPFLLLYTSGTTTAPKGVLHAYRNFLVNSRASTVELSVTSDDVLLSAAPFTHLYGLFTLNMALAVGATVRLLPVFTPPDLAALMTSGEPTIAFTAPAHIAACLGMKLFEGKRLDAFKYVQISGSTVPPELGRAFEPLLAGGKVMQLWGMTELQAGAYTRLADDEAVRIETTGRPSPGTELRVVRDDGTPCAPGEIGELEMCGPSLFDGYLRNPEATAAAFTADGWFRTGDLAAMDAAGNTRLAGRTKDVINRGGVKFNPVDIEVLMLRHPAVAEAAVVGLPDPVLGERACLCATLRPGASLTLEDVQAWLAQHQISKTKWPERVAVVDAMPLTPTRKIIKPELVRRLGTS